MIRLLAFLAASLSAACLSFPVSAQTFPGKPIRIIVGYAAGGGNDIIVRVMTSAMQAGLGQPVLVENKPGAQSIIAAELVAKSPADGYTILMGPSGPMTMNPATYAKLPYSPTRDFAPISMICQFPLFVVVDPKLPVQSVRELVDYAKRNPGKVNYAASAAPFQIAAELLKQRTGTDFAYIPYKSSGDSIKAVMTGEVTMTISDPPPAVGPMKGGQVRVVAITSSKRHPNWPELPTVVEAGFPELEIGLWTAFFAPAGTPPAIVKRLQEEVARVVKLPEVRERFAAMGLESVGSTSEELARVVPRDIERWTGVAKAANITSQ